MTPKSNIFPGRCCRFFKLLLVCLLIIPAANAIAAGDTATLIGRWDITITVDGKERPSWLEVQRSGFHTLIGEYVGIVGSARPIASMQLSNGKLSFTIPPQWEPGTHDLLFEGTLNGDNLSGTVTSADGKQYAWNAVRAPALQRAAAPGWQQPEKLFNGKDLTGWHALGDNQWIVKDGVLQSPHSGANLQTDETFTDFKLHVEFRYPAGSNSGIYLRGRYEVQIEDAHEGEPYKGVYSAVYGFIAPSEIAAKKAGEWQTYDITLTGRIVTIVANGKTVVCNREIPGITGGAINSREGEPGPILIQGDHGPIEYRNIIITKGKQ